MSWTSTNAVSCTASGAWSGSKATSSPATSTGNLTASSTYTLTCTGPGGSAADSVTVNVSTPAAHAPDAAVHCVPASCSVYENDTLTMHNTSTDPDGEADIVKSEWDIIGVGASPDASYSGLGNLNALFTPKNYLFAAGIATGTYTVQLTVYDATSLSDSISKSITIKQDAKADFECSLTGNPGDWHSVCSDIAPKIGDTVYFKDASHASEGASISSRAWTFEDGIPAGGSTLNPTTTFQSVGEKDVILQIVDSASRGNSVTKTLTVGAALPPPGYREVPPFIWLKNTFLAFVGFFFNFFQ